MQHGCVITMSRSESLKYQILNRFLEGGISRAEAATALGKSIWTISRQATKIRKVGLVGIKHGNINKVPSNKVNSEIQEKVLKLIKMQYFDFNVTHLREILKTKHAISVSYSTLWRWCAEKRLIKAPKKSRRNLRRIRPRMAEEGYFLQMDGCEHPFNGQDTWCLIGAIDDATSDIPYAEFFYSETTLNCMQVLRRIIELKGVPKIIYTDQAGWSGKIKREQFTQFKRACDDLGITLIFANSAEAKGRIERAWRTFQDRLCPELRLNGIKEMADANEYLQNNFLPNYWRKNCTQKAFSPEVAYAPLDEKTNLDNILCVENFRKIAKDQSISWHGTKFEIVTPHSFNLRNYEAVVRHYINGSTKVFVMGIEVGVRTTDVPAYFDKLADQEANVCLLASYQNVIPTAYKYQEEHFIKTVYGSRETYEKYGKKSA